MRKSYTSRRNIMLLDLLGGREVKERQTKKDRGSIGLKICLVRT